MKKFYLVILFCFLGVYSYSQVPNPPILLHPIAGDTVCTLTPTFSWSASSGGTSYRIQVSTDSTFFTNLVINFSGTNTNYVTPSGILSYNTNYYWRVNATGPGGTSGWSNVARFVIPGTTIAPTLVSPPNNAANISLTPTFTWNSVAGAVKYRLQINGGPTTLIDTIITTNSFTITTNILTSNTMYYWRVAAINICGLQGTWSAVFVFTTITQIPGAPSLIAPPNNSIAHSPVNFDWSDVQGATYYHLQLALDQNFTMILKDSNHITSSNITLILPRGHYYWRVNASNLSSTGPWSDIWNFYVRCFISGNVKYNDNNQTVTGGIVKAFKLDKNTGNLITLDSTSINPDGSYILNNVPQDSLDIGVFPNSTPPNDYVITYYPSTIYWQNATVLFPVENMSNVNISAIRLSGTTASNSANGKILKIINNISGNLKDAFIYAKNGNTFVRCAVSDENGIYHLQSLPSGTLKIIVNHLGFAGDSATVNMSSTGNLDSINFRLNNVFVGVNPISKIIPSECKLFQNYPNPFNPVTNIKFYIKENDFVSLKVFNIIGMELFTLINQKLSAGEYEIQFYDEQLPSGIYFYTLRSGSFTDTKKMLLIK